MDWDAQPETVAQPAWWVGLRRFFWMTPAERETEQAERLEQLNHAIARHPDEVAAVFLLRARLFLEQDQLHLAQADLEEAIASAESQLVWERWGLTAQAIRDQAMHELSNLRRRLGRST